MRGIFGESDVHSFMIKALQRAHFLLNEKRFSYAISVLQKQF